MNRAVVDALAAQWRATLAQMNANLMRTAGLESAFDECMVSELLHDPHMCNSVLAGFGRRCTPAPAISPVSNQIRFEAARRRAAANHSQVATLDGVRAKLTAEIALGLRRSGKHQQSARLLVETVNRAQAERSPPLLFSQMGSKQICQRGGQKTACSGTEICSLLRMAHGRKIGWLVSYDDVGVKVANDRPGRPRLSLVRWPAGDRPRLFSIRHFQPLAGSRSAAGIETGTTA
jgi:hypothetical protein